MSTLMKVGAIDRLIAPTFMSVDMVVIEIWLIKQLQRLLLQQPNEFASGWNWIDVMLRLEHDTPIYRMLRQALLARRVLIILDGLDESGSLRERIERHVAEVLAPQGHVMLVTSRPAGLDVSRFAEFRSLELAPLSDAQQQMALERRLGDHAKRLLDYLRTSVPVDEETGRRVTSNPLMLSMVASVFELRQGVGMPTSKAELYRVASDAMLARGGVVSAQQRRLLQSVFYEVQHALSRIITEDHLERAAFKGGVDGREGRQAVRQLKERALCDQMPLLSLLQAEPLQLQSSHLSFQEYFAAAQLCEEGTQLSGPPPWQWDVFWSNTIALGSEMGERFVRGVARAAGVTGQSLDLSTKLASMGGDTSMANGKRTSGDQVTSLQIVMQLSTLLKKLDLSNNYIGAEGFAVIAKGLETNRTLTVLDLSFTGIQPQSALVIAEALKVNTTLLSLDLGGYPINIPQLRGACPEPAQAIDLSGLSLGEPTGIVIATLLETNMVLTTLDLSRNPLGDRVVAAIAKGVKMNSVLHTLDLSLTCMGSDGAIALADALKMNRGLKSVDVRNNSLIGHGAVVHLRDAISECQSLKLQM